MLGRFGQAAYPNRTAHCRAFISGGQRSAYPSLLPPPSLPASLQAAENREAELVRVADTSKTALTKLEQNATTIRREVGADCTGRGVRVGAMRGAGGAWLG